MPRGDLTVGGTALAPTDEGAAPPAERPQRRGWLLHPLLIGSYPVLFLFGRNASEVPVGRVLVPLLAVLAGVVVVLGLLTLVLRDVQRAGLGTSVLALGVLGYGHLRNAVAASVPALEGTDGGRALLIVFGALLVGLVWVAVRVGRQASEKLTRILNLGGIALVALALWPAAPALAAEVSRAMRGSTGDPGISAGAAGATRDIYYLVLDRYGQAETLERELDVDNHAFIQALRRRGFFVADDSRANYLKSAQSLASSLNMGYHHEEFARTYGPGTASELPMYERLADHRVGRVLQDRGYTYVHIGSWWDPTQGSPIADADFGYGGRSDFADALFEHTVVAAAVEAAGWPQAGSDFRTRHFEAARAQFAGLRRASRLDGPTFVFAHVLLPHEPYVFDADGSFVPADTASARGREEGFARQLAYLNSELEALLDQWMDRAPSERPVIVLQGDEGPHPERYEGTPGFDWGNDATNAELAEKFRILNAYYLPGVDDPGLYPGITPVNTFRLIFDAYLDADLPLLPDRSFVFRNTKHPYDYTEITERLDQGP